MTKNLNHMRLFLIFVLLFFTQFAEAQVVLQMEKFGTPRTVKFYEGQELTFLLKGEEEEWTKGKIERLIPERNMLLLDYRYVTPEQIAGIRTYKNRGWSRAASVSLYTFGVAWTGFSLVSALIKPEPPALADPYTIGDVTVAVTSISLGFMIQRAFRHDEYKFGKKRRLRIVDLTVVPF